MKHFRTRLVFCLLLGGTLSLTAQDNSQPSMTPEVPEMTSTSSSPTSQTPTVQQETPTTPTSTPPSPVADSPSTTTNSQPPAATPAPAKVEAVAAPKAEPKAPAAAAAPKAERVTPQTFGDTTGQVYIGHRAVVDRYAGWGWIWKQGEGYRRGKWVLMQEEPGVRMVPGRFLSHPEADNDMEYKIYGEFLPFRGYEPNYDVYTDVFRIKGFEVIGKAEPLKLRPPAPSGKARNSSTSRVHDIGID